MSSFVTKCVTNVVSVGWRGYLGERSKGWRGACGNEAANSQHGTGVGGSFQPRTKLLPKVKGFLCFITAHVFGTIYCCKNACVVNLYFFSPRAKSYAFTPGPVAWLGTESFRDLVTDPGPVPFAQCCGARAGAKAARSWNFWPELEPVFAGFGSGSWLWLWVEVL